jgi:hypothetical protein
VVKVVYTVLGSLRTRKQAVLVAAALAAIMPACRDRGAPRRACPAQGALDPTLSFSRSADIVGAAGDAWAIGSRSLGDSGQSDVPLHWNGCDWQVAGSPIYGETRLSALAANGSEIWLAGSHYRMSEEREVFHRDGRISWVRSGWPRCDGPGRFFRRHGNEWQEVDASRANALEAPKGGKDARDQSALAIVGPDEFWMLSRPCSVGYGFGGASLARSNGKRLVGVDLDGSIGAPNQVLLTESRAWPWSEPVQVLWLGGSEGVGRWDGHGWSWFRFAEPGTASRFAGGGSSDLWAFGTQSRHWDGREWSIVRLPPSDDSQPNPPSFLWAGAVAGGHTFALDSTGAVFRSEGMRLARIGRVRGQVTGFAAGRDELWLWAIARVERPVLRWSEDRWEVSRTAQESGVTLAAGRTRDIVGVE